MVRKAAPRTAPTPGIAAGVVALALGAALCGAAWAQPQGGAPPSAVIARYPLCDDPRFGVEEPYLHGEPDPGLTVVPRRSAGGAGGIAGWDGSAPVGDALLVHPYLTPAPRDRVFVFPSGARIDPERLRELRERAAQRLREQRERRPGEPWTLERDTPDGLLYTCP